jgi:5,6-dimethylbenzimidazole synthase
MAPSVGYCQPWRFIVIKNQQIKNEIYNNFQSENQKAKEQFKDSKLYQNLKLEGIKEAPINIAVLYEAPKKTTLGMTSIEKSGEYSVVCAVQNMWLVARSLNIGVGWVSILDEKRVLKTIDETNSKLIAYLCVGYVDKFLDEPELKKLKWEDEKKLDDVVKYI